MGFEAMEKDIKAIKSEDCDGTAMSSNISFVNGAFHANGYSTTLEESNVYEENDQAPKYEKANGKPELPISSLKNGTVNDNGYAIITVPMGQTTHVLLASNSSLFLQTVIQTAWTIVVNRFTGINAITFSVIDSAIEQNMHPAVERSISLDKLKTLGEIINHFKGQSSSATSHQEEDKEDALSGRVDSILHSILVFREDFLQTPSYDGQFPTRPSQLDVDTTHTQVSFKFLRHQLLESGDLALSVAHAMGKALDVVTSAEPDISWQDMNLLSNLGRDQIEAWNQEEFHAADICIHDLFHQQVLSRPSAHAVSSWDGRLTYSEIDIASDNLASELVSMGIRRGSLVPFCFEKSVRVTISILAVLKAGGAIVPLDAAYPKQRLIDIVDQANASVVICDPRFSDIFGEKAKTLIVEKVPRKIQKQRMNGVRAPALVYSNDPAVVLFTSGSTGQPKGLIHTHSSMSSSVLAYGSRLNIKNSSRILQFSSYSFDISIIDNLAALIHGACLCVPSESERLDDTTGFIQRARCNWAYLTPSFARQIQSERVPGLETLVLGGENVPQDVVQDWATSSRQIINGYGPAECGICCTEVLNPVQPPGIGTGLACRTWVADLSNGSSLAPLGCVGELLIEGPIVFKGYLNQEEATDAALIQDPPWLHEKRGRRRMIYKTGDLVHYRSDGTLMYVGRRDRQIKLRGQRIELAEVEQRMSSLLPRGSAVAADVMNSANDGTPTLVAFVCVKEISPDFLAIGRKIQRGLESSLPSYMIPSAFIPLETLPMTLNNKLDRNKLKELAYQFTQSQLEISTVNRAREQENLISFTDTEQRLAMLWHKVLNLKFAVKKSDNFFVLGADSLKAIALVSAAREDGLRISVAQILRQPCLSNMAENLTPFYGSTDSPAPLEMIPEESKENIFYQALKQCHLTRNEVEDIYPCTSLQEGLYVLSLAYPGTYIAQILYELPSAISVSRFKEAWRTVIERNAVLRTRIVQVASRHYQVVTKPKEVFWSEHRSLEEFSSFEKEDSSMDYGRSLLHMAIVIDSRFPRFVFTAHHSIYDGWSLDLLWQQVQEEYMHHAAETQPRFSSFIRFLQDTEPSSEHSKAFWQSQFQESSPAQFPPLPSASYQPSADASYITEFEVSQLSSEVTLSIAVRSAWAVLLSQYCGSQDIIFGATVSGRFAPFDGIERLPGPTIATIPVRAHIDKQMSVHEYLKDVQRRAAEMVPYEHIGLQALIKLIPEAREVCSFPSLLIVQPPQVGTSSTLYNKAEVRQLRLPHALIVECHLNPGKISVDVNFDSQVVQLIEVERAIAQFQHILQQICQSNETTSLREIKLTSPTDLQMIHSWNRHLPLPENVCIHTEFERRAAETPFAEAVCAWDGTLTYGELNETASRLALHLFNNGVGPEIIVPLYFDKSKYVIISLLAVLKAGGACLFLDSSWPTRRIDFILHAVKATVVVAEPKYCSIFDPKVDKIVEISAALVDNLPAIGDHAVTRNVQPDNASFVFFTSGSTGNPKGIVQEHTALITSSKNHAFACNINAESRVLQFSAFTFDVFEIEIVTTLTHGGCVCVPSEYDRMNNLVGVMEEMRVNWAFFTPTFCRPMNPKELPQLKTLLVGGEAVDKATIDKWMDHVLLVNCYGPAECGPSVMCEITPSHRPESIGKPVCCVSWIVEPDDYKKLAPVGTVGELALEGYTMARGYLNEPEKTAAAFVTAPEWLARAGHSRAKRIYKTGDLVQYSGDGQINFIGRKDTQVKIRGQRIELGEVEHHMRKCLPSTVDVAAETVELPNRKDRKSLVAFACFKNTDLGSDATILTKREEQHERLSGSIDGLEARMGNAVPASMVPSAVLMITKMPTNSSGKLDRKVLQRLATETPPDSFSWLGTTHAGKTAVQTDMEKTLHDLWSQTLKPNSSIFREDNFFRRGGDSITAISLVAEARLRGLSLSVEQIFKQPTLQGMASTLTVVEGDMDDDTITKFSLLPPREDVRSSILHEIVQDYQISTDSIEDIYPCTSLQEGLLALSMTRPGTYISQHVYEIIPHTDLSKFQEAWDSVVREQPVFRTRLVQTSHGTLQVTVADNANWLRFQDLRAYLEADKTKEMAPGQPMVRLGLSDTSPDVPSHFVLTLHHSIYDGWSLDIAWKAAADAFSSTTLDGSVPFTKFVKYLLKPPGDAEKIYWQNQLEGANKTAFPEVPVGHLSLATSMIAHPKVFQLPAGDSHFATTLPNTIRAAWSLLIARYTLTDDVTFAAISAGRSISLSEAGRIAGPLTTTIPVRVRIDYEQSISSFLSQIQSQAVGMIPFEHTGLQNIKQCIGSEIEEVCDTQSLLVIQPLMKSHEALPGAKYLSTFSDIKIPNALLIECSLIPNGFSLKAGFDPAVLNSGSVKRIMRQLEYVVSTLYSLPSEKKLGEINMMDPTDRHAMISMNQTVPAAVDVPIHDIISQRAKERPKSIAVDSWDGELTYEQLHEQSELVSAYLRNDGIGSEEIVPILIEKSCWAVVGALGVLKSGGAFVLVDLATSSKPLSTILFSVKAKVILTSMEGSEKLTQYSQSKIVVLNNAQLVRWKEFKIREGSTNVDPQTAGAAAYVNFTSGSTSDTPKAVVTEHRAVSTAFLEHGRVLGINHRTRILQYASYKFDSAIWEILTALMQGSCVCIPSETQRLEDISGFICLKKVNLAILTPTVARATLNKISLQSLKMLILVGEPMSRDDIPNYTQAEIQLINGYGLTECCVASSVLPIGNPDDLSVIKPIASNIWITEPNNHDCLSLPGTVGEILIEGPVLAREYLNDKARTEASFIRDPLWSIHIRPMRLYKTGDLGSFNTDGTITLMGRKDRQVKLRGQRIDLTEVERVIKRQLPPCCIEVTCDSIVHGGQTKLVAFVCMESKPESGKTINGLIINSVDAKSDIQKVMTILKRYVSSELPRHMQPTAYIPVHQIPLLASGKVNRRELVNSIRSLSAEELAHFSSVTLSRSSKLSSEPEIKLATQWAETFGVTMESISANDNFFAWGDSIAAIKLSASLRGQGLALSAADIIRNPSLSDMARKVTRLEKNVDTPSFEPFDLVREECGDLFKELAEDYAISEVEVEDMYPCTPLQEGLMALSMKQMDTFVARNVLALPHSVDIERLLLAWQKTIDANPILRTTIVQTKQKGMMQVVLKSVSVMRSTANISQYVSSDKATGLTLAKLFNRFALVEHPERSHFVWTSHHATYDGWSVDLIFQQVEQAYQGLAIEQSLPFRSYLDHMALTDADAAMTFWRSECAAHQIMSFPALPSPSYRPVADTSISHSEFIRKGSRISAAKLHAAWAFLSAKYQHDTKISFGVVMSGRTTPIQGIEKVVGPTISTVPLAISINEDQTFSSLTDLIEQKMLGMIPFAHVGLQNIRRLSPEANSICNFQTIVIVQPHKEVVLPCGATRSSEESYELSSFNNYGLMLEFQLGVHDLKVTANFDSNLIDKTIMTQMLQQLTRVLGQCHSREVKLRDIELVNAQEVELPLGASNVVEAKHITIHELIAFQAKIRSNKLAISGWDAELTYAHLDELSTNLANYLVDHRDFCQETIVLLYFERSAWTIVSLIAVFKAGGTALLLDSTHPMARLEGLVAETQSKLLLCDRKHANTLAVGNTIEVTADFVRSLPTGQHQNVPVRADQTAVVLSTSGSTGKPKIMRFSHEAICTSMIAYGSRFNLHEECRVLQFAAYAFDISLNEMLATFFHGGCLCIPSEHDRMNNFVSFIQNMQVNWLFVIPSFLRRAQILPGDIPSIQNLIFTGEKAQQDDIDRWKDQVNLFSAYGPAECQICTGGALHDAGEIGIPFACACWIVDPENVNRLCPVGMVGELVVEGPIVSQGYLNASGDPFSIKPAWASLENSDKGNRYLTGDLVKVNRRGTLTYIGRKEDTQIKVRGQRLEVGEVEHGLRRALPPDLDVVAAISNQLEPPALVAFVSSTTRTKPLDKGKILEEWRNAQDSLRDVYPEYMIPSGLVILDQIPLISSGKVDRKKLRMMKVELEDTFNEKPGGGLVSDLSDLARILRGIWCNILDIHEDSIGARINFFRLGGDSILAVRLVSVARSHEIHLTVADIFEHPTLQEMAEISSPSEDDQQDPAPLSMLGEGAENILDEASEQCKVPPNLIEDMYPCTPLQEGLFALSQKSGAYIARSVFELDPALDLASFKNAWERIISFNPILRTSIVQASNTLYQVVHKNCHIWTEAYSLSEIVKSQPMISLGEPLTQLAIADSHFFILTQHHAAYDGHSLPQIFHHVENFCQNVSSCYPGVPFSRFVRHSLEANDTSSKEFWASELAGSVPSVFPHMPPGYEPSPSSSIQRELVLSRISDATTSTLLRTAWALVLSSYTGTQDVVFGATLSGRQAAVRDIDRIIGPTITTVPIRIKLDQDMTVGQLLQVVQSKAAKMIPHEQLGLQNIKALLNEDEAAACEFQNLLIVNPEPQTYIKKSSVFKPYKVKTSKARVPFRTYALNLECTIMSKTEVSVEVIYDSGIIESAQVLRLLNQLQHVCNQITQSASQTVLRELNLVNSQDKAQIAAWNERHQAEPPGSCVHYDIQRQAHASADRPAISFGDGSEMSYRTLDKLSSKLSWYLHSVGSGPGVNVALCFEKSPWMVVALLAIIKSGGCFVPLDPSSYPVGRLKYIVEETNALIVLASPQHKALFGSAVEVSEDSITGMDPSWEDFPDGGFSPTGALYILFTSGSTGQPKGVVIEHQAFSLASQSRRKLLGLNQNSRVLQFSSYSFDVSIEDMLSTLMAGGCICIPSETERKDALALTIQKHRVNYANLTPSVASLIDPDSVPCLRTLVLAGEPVTRSLVEVWWNRVRLVNAYGPTECSVLSLIHMDMTPNKDPKNIGYAVGCNGWVVDPLDHNKLVAIGAPGELLIEGSILARGYLNDENKTALSFIENPTWARRPTRVYKTGDLVCHNTDGSMTYIRRTDGAQVKIRGQRVELGEVQSVLRPLLAESENVVVDLVHQDSKPAALTAFVKFSDPVMQVSKRSMVKKALFKMQEILPSHMLPTVVVFPDQIPLSSAAKIDRRELRRIALGSISKGTAIFADDDPAEATQPISDLQQRIQLIWSGALNIAQSEIGVNTPFVRLGGDSISAIRVVGKCRAQGISVTSYDILKLKTITKICQMIEEEDLGSKSSNQEEEEESEDLFDLSPIQRQFFLLMPEGNNYFQQSFQLRVMRDIAPERMEIALHQLVIAHPMLRATFTKQNGQWMQRLRKNGASRYIYQGNECADFEAFRRILDESIDIQNGLVFAAGFFKSSSDSLLYLTAHHLVIDLVSWRIIFDDLECFIQDSSISIEKEPLTFSKWSHLQKERSQRPLSFSDAAVLSTSTTSLDDAYWGLGKHKNIYEETDSEFFILEESTSTSLLGASNSPLSTEPIDLFLACLFHSFQFIFPERDPPTIFNESHGREPWEKSLNLSRTVGWFTTMNQLFVSADEDLIETVCLTKDARRRVKDNGMSSFTSYYLDNGNISPLQPEIMFNYHGQYQQLERKDALFQHLPVPTPSFSRAGSNVIRQSVFEVSAMVQDRKIRIDFLFPKSLSHRDRIEKWIQQCRRSLEEAAARLSGTKPRFTLSDFPLIPANFRGLSTLLTEVFPQLPSTVEDVHPCSPMQRKMFLSQNKGSGCYETWTEFRAISPQNRKKIDMERLQRAWQSVVDSHSILRTCICRVDDHVLQVVLENHKAEMFIVGDQNFDAVASLFNSEPRTEQTLRPMHQMYLRQELDGSIVCRLEIHHALIDGTSLQIVLQDLASAYESGSNGPRGRSTYREYMSYLNDSRSETSVEFWNKYVQDLSPCNIPAVMAKSPSTRFTGACSYEIELSDVQPAIHAFCKHHNITISALIQTVWALVLRFHTHQDRVCFGFLVSGRNIPIKDVSRAIGPFFNILPCAFDLKADMCFSDALEASSENTISSLPHEKLPLPEILKDEEPGQMGLFNTVVNFRKYAVPGEEQGDSDKEKCIVFEAARSYDPFDVS